MAQSKDYYSIMGLQKSASDKDIKMAYRRLARKYHPDLSKDPNGEEKFKELGQAYEVLKDPEKRAAYDKYGENWEHGASAQQQQQSYGHYAQQPPPNTADFNMGEDFFETLFGHARRRQAPSMAGEDYQANLSLTLEEAFHGTTRQLEIPLQNIGSNGQVQASTQTLNVKIPAGVKQGHKIRLAGQGAPGFNQGPKGDLYLNVHFQKHAIYEVKDNHIYLSLPITPWEAALGATIKVPTLAGAVNLKIPKGAQSGQTLRLKGRGLSKNDDQLVILKIMIPEANTEAAKKLYEEMAQVMPFNPRANLGV
ncbi:MAG: DnaJ C-terminal domain-containing protein [Legionellaceae bacterium]|nr:DnaJ C-terminal domain-containing protein [Legionellaceae bacterium]